MNSGVIEMDTRELVGTVLKALVISVLFALIYLFLRAHPDWGIAEGENFVLFFQVLLGTVLAGFLSAMAFSKVDSDWEAVKAARLGKDKKALDLAMARTLHPAFKIVLAASYSYLSLGGAMLVRTPPVVALPGILLGETMLWFVFLIIMDLASYSDGIWYVKPIEE